MLLKGFHITPQKMKFSIKNFFRKPSPEFLGDWSHFLKKSLMENFIFVQCVAATFFLRSWFLLQSERLRSVFLSFEV